MAYCFMGALTNFIAGSQRDEYESASQYFSNILTNGRRSGTLRHIHGTVHILGSFHHVILHAGQIVRLNSAGPLRPPKPLNILTVIIISCDCNV